MSVEKPLFVPPEFNSEEIPNLSFMDILVENAYQKFTDKAFIEDIEEGTIPYTGFDAVKDAILEVEIDPLSLFAIVADKTRMGPEVLDSIDKNLYDEKKWRHVAIDMLQAIIFAEMADRHDEVWDEDQRRIGISDEPSTTG